MPIFEYKCRGCGHEFEALVRKSDIPACPSCNGTDLERLLSLPALKTETTKAQAMKAARPASRNSMPIWLPKAMSTMRSGRERVRRIIRFQTPSKRVLLRRTMPWTS